jgi:hypothetical protein
VGDERQARKLFFDFHGVTPLDNQIQRIGMDSPTYSMLVGPLLGVIYLNPGDGKEYHHEFPKRALPRLWISSDGRQFFALGGSYRFTQRGFEN